MTVVAAFLGPGLFLLFWWLAYNWARLGNPLYFLGTDPERISSIRISGDLGSSFFKAFESFNLGLIGVIGWPVIMAGLAGLVLLLFSKPFSSSNYLVWLLLFVYPLGVFMAWANVALFRDLLPDPSSFSQTRYSLLVLPSLSLLVAFAIQWVAVRWQRLGRIIFLASFTFLILNFAFEVISAKTNTYLLQEAIIRNPPASPGGGVPWK